MCVSSLKIAQKSLNNAWNDSSYFRGLSRSFTLPFSAHLKKNSEEMSDLQRAVTPFKWSMLFPNLYSFFSWSVWLFVYSAGVDVLISARFFEANVFVRLASKISVHPFCEWRRCMKQTCLAFMLNTLTTYLLIFLTFELFQVEILEPWQSWPKRRWKAVSRAVLWPLLLSPESLEASSLDFVYDKENVRPFSRLLTITLE